MTGVRIAREPSAWWWELTPTLIFTSPQRSTRSGACWAVSRSGPARAATRNCSSGRTRSVRRQHLGSKGPDVRAARLVCLVDAGCDVIEINRPDRRARRGHGKSDPIDAEAAARSVLAGGPLCIAKRDHDRVGMIRTLRVARRSAIKMRTKWGTRSMRWWSLPPTHSAISSAIFPSTSWSPSPQLHGREPSRLRARRASWRSARWRSAIRG